MKKKALCFVAALILVLLLSMSSAGANDVRAANGFPRTWYFAEGSTMGGFETWILLENPLPVDVPIDIILNTDVGEVILPGLTDQIIPAESRVSFPIHNYYESYHVAAKVMADTTGGEACACERAVYWTPPGSDQRVLGTASIGSYLPAPTWYLAEGSTEVGYETWVLVQNPGEDLVHVNLTLHTDEGEVAPADLQDVAIDAKHRMSFNIGDYVTTFDVSTMVECTDGDVVCERAMYWTNLIAEPVQRTLGHCSIGSSMTSDTWYLAEGATDGGFDTFILVQNPNPNPVDVDLTLYTDNGTISPLDLQNISIPPKNRRTFWLDNYVTTFDISTQVKSTGGGVVCERSMYWSSMGDELHRTLGTDSIGAIFPGPFWFFAEGVTAGGFETWILVQNPLDIPVHVDFTLYTAEGAVFPPELQGVEILPLSRRSFNIGDYVTTYDVSTMVEVTDYVPGEYVVCERAVYWTPTDGMYRELGTCSIGFHYMIP
jgi:hypothetical protein